MVILFAPCNNVGSEFFLRLNRKSMKIGKNKNTVETTKDSYGHFFENIYFPRRSKHVDQPFPVSVVICEVPQRANAILGFDCTLLSTLRDGGR